MTLKVLFKSPIYVVKSYLNYLTYLQSLIVYNYVIFNQEGSVVVTILRIFLSPSEEELGINWKMFKFEN